MEKINRILFVSGHGISRAPMAAELLRRKWLCAPVRIFARGRLVQFPEPLNQKTEAVLISNGINISDYLSAPLADEEITPDALIFCMEKDQCRRLIRRLEHATEDNTYLLSAAVGDELEILNPYGGTLQTYGLCFEVLKNTIDKLADLLNETELETEALVCRIRENTARVSAEAAP